MSEHRFAYRNRRYRQYVEWIALNDNDADGADVALIADYLSVVMVADVNGLRPAAVAEDVAHIRRESGRAEKVHQFARKEASNDVA